MKVVIEKAREEDKPAIFALLEQVNMHYIPSREMPEIAFENYFVARVGGQVVGFCGYKILSSDEAKTELMVVDDRYRGHGIGYKLQLRRMEEMLRKGVRTLTTNADLPSAIEWYKKHFGYREVGKLKKFHEFGDPAIHEWTTLQVNLLEWEADRSKRGG